jgi:hypothetical protein
MRPIRENLTEVRREGLLAQYYRPHWNRLRLQPAWVALFTDAQPQLRNCISFVDHWDNEKSPKSAGVPSRTVPRHACKDRSRRCGHAAGENSSRPSGLRAGSPPSPPPRLIRPTVRRLPRSPRLSGPGPHRPPTGRYSASAGVISVMVWNSPRNSRWFCAR